MILIEKEKRSYILLAGVLKRDWFKVLAVTFSKISRAFFFFLQLLVNSFSIIFIIILIIIILIIIQLNSYLVSLLQNTLLFIILLLFIYIFYFSFIHFSFYIHFFSIFLHLFPFLTFFFALILCFQLVQQHCIIWSVIPSGLKSSEKNAKAVRRKKVEVALFCLCCCVIKVLWIYLK